MKSTRSLLAVLLALTFGASLALAQDQGGNQQPKQPQRGQRGERPARDPNAVYGTVVKVDGKDLVVSIRQRPADGGEATTKEQTIATNDDTKVTVNGEASTLDKLVKDQFVVITMNEDKTVATKIDARTPRQRGQGAQGGQQGGQRGGQRGGNQGNQGGQ